MRQKKKMRILVGGFNQHVGTVISRKIIFLDSTVLTIFDSIHIALIVFFHGESRETCKKSRISFGEIGVVRLKLLNLIANSNFSGRKI